ncbi:MAG TPA: nucleotide pyrophosphatase/phosphodiesterase family protein [Verrucomicrobiae bacterium]|nr:nucleotide pyrophosphatase/phosphodiesterase family protein [Verrucomicrobiae bacterium]
MKRTAVINVVGLSESLLGPATPRIQAFREAGSFSRIDPALPAVTCTAQATYLTGLSPSEHGIVGNGWYNRELAEVHFWKQSNRLVRGEKLWEVLRRQAPGFTCAQLFWWFNMYSSADWSITPRPMYPADGRKIFDIYAWPYSIRPEIKRELGEFPFPCFWGPAAGIDTAQGAADSVSRWIARAAQWIETKFSPSLNLIYLPHLDYNLQRLGPAHPAISEDLCRIDHIVGDLIDFFARRSVQVILLSEYGISAVDSAVHLNRLFREQGWLAIKEELNRELLDFGASRVFAVADHQVAHIYCQEAGLLGPVQALLEKQTGIQEVLAGPTRAVRGLDHPRAGDLIAIAAARSWFTYYYWLDDAKAPDFARTVDIHRKPGYDPAELFLDPAIPMVRAKIAWLLLQKRLGLRTLLNVIPLDPSLVRGSHGCRPADAREWPVLITSRKEVLPKEGIGAGEVFDVLRRYCTP